MDINFGEWYRTVHIEPDDKLLKRRWKGIESFSKDLTGVKVIGLARLFHARSPKDPEFQSQFRAAFFKADNAFQMQGNDQELAVLAGATLGYVLNGRDNTLGDVAAFATVCPTFQGKARTAAITDIQERARKYLAQRSSSIRTSMKRNGKRIPTLQIDELLQAISEACNTNAIANLSAPLTDLLGKFGTAIQKVIQNMNQVQRGQLLYREESDVLWWMQGKYSRDLKVPLDQIDLAAASIVAGKELADLTKVLPGPFAAQAFLHRILLRESSEPEIKVSLSSAINKSNREWRREWIQGLEESETLDLCPVLFAVNKSLESDNTKGWYAAFRKVTTLNTSIKIGPVEIALQVYEESLFIRAFNNAIRGK